MAVKHQNKTPVNQQKPVEKEIKERIDLEDEEVIRKTFPKWFWPFLGLLFVGIVLTMIFLTNLVLRRGGPVTSKTVVAPTPTLPAKPTMVVDELTIQSSSDELRAIQADLEATDLSGIDQELGEIEKELTAP